MKNEKTNVCRFLDKQKAVYTLHTYPHEEGVPVDAKTAAAFLHKKPEEVFKTLVTLGVKDDPYVFVVPANATLNLKKAAKACGEKSIRMLPLEKLLPLTGYVRGGCSPLGMKKHFPTFLDESCLAHDTILVSAGHIGMQVELAPTLLGTLCRARICPLAQFEEES